MTSYFGSSSDTDSKVFYKMANLDDRIKNADQLITVDLNRFANGLAEIYSNLAKPTLDVVLYDVQLARNIGAEGMFLLSFIVQGSAALRESLPPSKLARRRTLTRITAFNSQSRDPTFRGIRSARSSPPRCAPALSLPPRRVLRRDRLLWR